MTTYFPITVEGRKRWLPLGFDFSKQVTSSQKKEAYSKLRKMALFVLVPQVEVDYTCTVPWDYRDFPEGTFFND